MNTEEEEVQAYYNEILNDIDELYKSRLKEVNADDLNNLCIPNAPDREVSKEEIESIEYLNSVRDVKLRLEANILELELQLKRQQLSAVRASSSQSESIRNLTKRLKDHLILAEVINVRQASLAEIEGRQASISAGLADCKARLDRFVSKSAESQNDFKVTEEITQRVKLSIEHLTRQMELAGHPTVESMTSAIEAVRLEANRAERELCDLRRQADSMAAQLGESTNRADKPS